MGSATASRRRSVTPRALFAAFGDASYNAHLFEFALANVLVQVYGPGPSERTRAQVERELTESYRKTAGQLRTQLAKRLGTNSQLVTQVAEAVELRNRLAHDFFRLRAKTITTPEGRSAAVTELTQATTLFRARHTQLMQIYTLWLAEHS